MTAGFKDPGVSLATYFTDLPTRLVSGSPQAGIDELMPLHRVTPKPA